MLITNQIPLLSDLSEQPLATQDSSQKKRSYSKKKPPPGPAEIYERSVQKKRTNFIKKFDEKATLELFDEVIAHLKLAPIHSPVLDYLNALVGPLCEVFVPTAYRSDVAGVTVVENDALDNEEAAVSVIVERDAWGEVWIEDSNGMEWSHESLLFLQNRLFWRSIEELALSNNEHDKWSVLCWIFRPPIWKHYVYDKAIGRSHCFPVHQRDQPFSFHNCCISACMDADLVREGVRRQLSEDILKAVEKVCSFS